MASSSFRTDREAARAGRQSRQPARRRLARREGRRRGHRRDPVRPPVRSWLHAKLPTCSTSRWASSAFCCSATRSRSSGSGSQVRKRQHAILLQIPDALDLLTISVRAGLGFDAALGKVVEKLKGPLTDEFRRALAEVRVGKARREALRDIVPRTEVPPLTNFIGAIIQAEQLGVSISKVLQVQSEQLRIERRQRAEEMAAKAPIKMLFPLVGCIFPSLFIVILGPAIILIMQNLSA